MAGGKKGNFAHPKGRRIDEVFKRKDWKARLNKRVKMSMVDFCFSINGPKSLLDETTLEGLVQVLEKNVSSEKLTKYVTYIICNLCML